MDGAGGVMDFRRPNQIGNNFVAASLAPQRALDAAPPCSPPQSAKRDSMASGELPLVQFPPIAFDTLASKSEILSSMSRSALRYDWDIDVWHRLQLTRSFSQCSKIRN